MSDDSPNRPSAEPFGKRLARLERRALPLALLLALGINGGVALAVRTLGWEVLLLGFLPTAVIWGVWRAAIGRARTRRR